MINQEEGRSDRVAVLKKLIIVFLIAGILLPIILCILLFIKVEQLQKQVNELRVIKQNVSLTALRKDDLYENSPSENIESRVAYAEPSQRPETQMESVREVQVISTQEDETAEEVQGTKVYLTFDDGPSSNTNVILDILKQYDVKATFFVTGKEQEVYLPMYRRIVEEGHTLGMHSYSHRYNEIYDTQDAFERDLEQLQEFLYDVTGVWSRFYRFPGGSSNNVSKVPMLQLTEYLDAQDIFYLDWNVSCLDATGRKLTPQQIADNVTENVTKYHTAVVLLHDASDKTSTVEALPLIIEELQSMEYVEIVPVSDDMNIVQHLKMDR